MEGTRSAVAARVMNVFTTSSMLVLATLLSAAAPGRAQESVEGAMSYRAEDFIGNVKDLQALTEEAVKAKWVLGKAAKVEGLSIAKDAGRITLDGWVFLKEPLRGVTSEAQFFGKGRFELTPPIKMERQQVRRFLGKESVDVPLDAARLTFYSVADQKLFEGLEYTEANAAAAKENEKAKAWMENSADFYARGRTAEAEDRAKYDAFFTAVTLYERLLYPRGSTPFSAEMSIEVPKEQQTLVHLQTLSFQHDPSQSDEVQLLGTWDHGKRKWSSVVTAFASSNKYDGKNDYAGTSPAIEADDRRELGADRNVLVATINPGESGREMVLRSTMDLRVIEDGLKHVALYITTTMRTTKAKLDGKEVEFVQPEIPGTVPQRWAPAIVLLLPRPYKKGETLTVELELEGKVLANYDGFTWIVLQHDAWYPNPTAAIGAFYKGHFDATFRVPKGYIAVAPGTETPCRPEDVEADMDCLRYVPPQPIDRFAFNIGKGLHVDRGLALDGTPVAVYTNAVSKAPFAFYTEAGVRVEREYSLTKGGVAVLNKARAALGTYERWFGDYPYQTLALTPHPKGYGQMFPSFIFLAQDAFLSDAAQGERAAITGRYPDPWWVDAFVTHEVAHSWWGGKAGIRGDRDQWFSEGFADYGSVLCLEAFDEVDGTQTMKKELGNWHERLMRDDGYVHDVAPLALGNRIDSAQNREGFQGVRSWYIYNKGGFVMHMLRTLGRALKGDTAQGDELFRKAIRTFLDEQSGNDPSNLDLQASLSRTYGTDLSWFFDQWVYGLGVPKLDFAYTMVTGEGGAPVLRGRIRQRDTEFRFPISVVLHWGKGKGARTAHFYQWVTSKEKTFDVPLPERPDKVTINDDYGVLCSVKEVPWEGAAAGQ